MNNETSADSGVTKEIIQEFDQFLLKKGLSFHGVAVGAAPLILIDVIERMTRDCDILDPEIPNEIKDAALEFASLKGRGGHGLIEDWFNNGPESLKELLPEGWRERIRPAFLGEALTLHTLGRMDLLKSKLFAYCDRETDMDDCMDMNPTADELEEAMPWIQEQDGNPMWSDHVEKKFKELEDQLSFGREKTRDLDRGGGFDLGM